MFSICGDTVRKKVKNEVSMRMSKRISPRNQNHVRKCFARQSGAQKGVGYSEQVELTVNRSRDTVAVSQFLQQKNIM